MLHLAPLALACASILAPAFAPLPTTAPQDPAPAADEAPADPFANLKIVSIDVYGARTIDPALLRKTAGLAIGDGTEFDKPAIEARLRALEGVEDARLVTVMMPGRAIAMIGIVEAGAPALELRAEPEGDVRLPAEALELYDRMNDLMIEGMMAGEAGERIVNGYAVSKYEPLADVATRFAELALAEPDTFAAVLRDASDAKHRAVAAKGLTYLDDKVAVVRALSAALVDPDPGVRNNATRGLSVLANYVADLPERPSEATEELASERDELARVLAEHLDPAPLFAMLESIEWTDRNKSSALLASLVELPNAELRAALSARSLPALAEMARWSSRGHSLFATRVLLNLAGREVKAGYAAEQAAREAGSLDAWVAELVAGVRAGASLERGAPSGE